MRVITDIEKIKENLDEDDSLLVFFKREDLFIFIGRAKGKGFIIDPAFITSIEINNEHFECAYIYKKSKTYNQTFILKDVIAPYRMNGKPRGWFSGLEDKPQRFTGVSNSIYFNSNDPNTKAYMYLTMLIQYDDNKILIDSNDEDLIKAFRILKENINKDYEYWLNYHLKNEKIEWLKNPEENIEKTKSKRVLKTIKIARA